MSTLSKILIPSNKKFVICIKARNYFNISFYYNLYIYYNLKLSQILRSIKSSNTTYKRFDSVQ